jgi:hypothetical protein
MEVQFNPGSSPLFVSLGVFNSTLTTFSNM